MKKRLYWIIFSSFTAFFLFLLTVIAFLYDFYPFNNIVASIKILLIALVCISILSTIVNRIVFKETIKPVDEFINYISKIIVNDPNVKKLDREKEQHVIDMLKEQGFDSDEIKKGLNRLLESSRVRREFSANVTHELKSPLTSINGFAEMIAIGIATGDEAVEFAQRINKEGNRLLQMIDQTIQLSKIDNHYIKSDSFTMIDLGSIIEENIESLSAMAYEKNVKINYIYKEVNFFGNSKLIFDLFRNLISNSIKYSSDKKPYLNIKIEDKIDKIKVYFEDNGIGIDKSEQARIFERFYVVDKSRGNKTGTGLGLSLVKNIVQFHHGEVLLDSEIGKGSTFTVILPKLTKKDYI